LGNGIPLRRMRAFEDEGHTGVLIVGDYTTRIGDPSGRKTERPMIDPAVIDANAQRYFEHASTIIDPERTELRFNSEWLGKLDFAEVLRLTRTTTVARMLERDDFAKRFSASEPISVSELLYPLMQAYDSVAVAEEHFTRVVREGQAPEDVPRIELKSSESTHLPALLVEHLGVSSTSEARRLISQGAVKVDGKVVHALDVPTAVLDGALI